jgi:hypothetical protein
VTRTAFHLEMSKSKRGVVVVVEVGMKRRDHMSLRFPNCVEATPPVLSLSTHSRYTSRGT